MGVAKLENIDTIRVAGFPCDYTYRDYNPGLVKYLLAADGDEQLYFYDKTDSLFFSYSIHTKKLLTSFKYPGPASSESLGASVPVDYFVKSPDSIYVFDKRGQLNQIDAQGRIQNTCNLAADAFRLSSNYKHPLSIVDSKFYLFQYPPYPLTNWSDQATQNYFKTHKIDVAFALDSNCSKQNATITFPSEFTSGKNYYTNEPYRTVNSQQVIYSYSPLEDLIVFNSKDGTESRVKLSSKYFKENEAFPFDYNYANTQEIKDYSFSNSRFRSVSYSQYTDKIYRVLLHAGEENNTIVNRYTLQKPWSLLIANGSNFEKTSEIVFDADQYDCRCVIPAKNGVIVSNINPRSDYAMNSQNDKLPYYEFSYITH